MEPQSTTNYFKELWKKYPSPISSVHPERKFTFGEPNDSVTCYCVAGSLLIDQAEYLQESDAYLSANGTTYIPNNITFPSTEHFAHALTFIFDLPNSDKVRDKMDEIARITMAYNDEERYGEAQSYLARNLSQFELQNG